MNFNVTNVSLVVIGAVLIYAGVKNQTPYAIVQELFGQSKGRKSKLTVESVPLGTPGAGGGGGGGGGSSW